MLQVTAYVYKAYFKKCVSYNSMKEKNLKNTYFLCYKICLTLVALSHCLLLIIKLGFKLRS